MLHASASAEIETGGNEEISCHEYHMLSPEGIDAQSLETFRASRRKVQVLLGVFGVVR